MRLIGINGFKRSGKGETGKAVADVLSDVKFESTLLIGFADKVKILGARTLGFTTLSDQECIDLMDEAKESWEFTIAKTGQMAPDPAWLLTRVTTSPQWSTREPVTTLTGRHYLQHLGTQARKVFGDDFWVDQVLPEAMTHGPTNQVRLRAAYSGMDCVAFTDLRFENEAKRVLDLGGEVWEVMRPGTASDGHDSEQVLPRSLVTRQIDNSGDLMALRYEVEKALGL
jgi:hypothetical protein